ncbi:MAG: hypothetical protein RLZ98_3097 [Pseudomonadota bacterium]
MMYPGQTVTARRVYPGLAAVVLAAVASASAPAQSVTPLLGSWSGMGKIDLQAGKSERIRCNAYNSSSSGELRLVIRCASTSYKVEVRSRLQQQGAKLSGEWEERTYNATGRASGTIGNGTLSLSITGGGFTGSMAVKFAGNSQTVTVTTEGIDMRSLTMSLTKSGS